MERAYLRVGVEVLHVVTLVVTSSAVVCHDVCKAGRNKSLCSTKVKEMGMPSIINVQLNGDVEFLVWKPPGPRNKATLVFLLILFVWGKTQVGPNFFPRVDVTGSREERSADGIKDLELMVGWPRMEEWERS